MRRWIDPEPVEVPAALRAAVGGHPLVAELLVRRGIADVGQAEAFLDPDRYEPAPPAALPDLERAVERIERAIAANETICVWGDFDVDGQTSTALLVETLRDLGADAFYRVPLRDEGHGIALAGLDGAIDQGARLILTCDTGIAEHDAVERARERGVAVVVTDHHDLPEKLPDAAALVDPKRLDQNHPLRELPGVGVAYKLTEALYARAGQSEDAERHLDLGALGIVADVAVQTGDTRHLLQRGLKRLRATKRAGLRALMEAAELAATHLTEEHIGFVLGPRLNALGRLADANDGVDLLTTDDPQRARVLAAQLEGLNARRKLLCDQVYQAALGQIERDPSLAEKAALALAHPRWPPGVIGIVASRLVERFGKPTVLIATPPDAPARGSARSVPGVPIARAIGTQADLLHGYGGHPMAAGLRMDAQHVDAFRRGLSRAVRAMLDESDWEPTLRIDAEVGLSAVTLALVEQLERLAPFGPGNPAPALVSRELRLRAFKDVGREGEHRKLTVEDVNGTARGVMWWHGGGEPEPKGRFDLVYTARSSDYRGLREVELEWIEARPLEAQPEAETETVRVIDRRGASDPKSELDRLRGEGAVQVWREGDSAREIEGADRSRLEACERLAIWTVPPGPAVLRAVMERVQPDLVHVFAVNAGHNDPQAFLKQLAGLLKYALKAVEAVTVQRLAAATAQREASVRAGLDWLHAKGVFRIQDHTAGTLELGAGHGQARASLDEAMERLRALLAESVAYRNHFRRASPTRLLG